MRTGHGNRLRRVPAETWLILVIMGIGAVLRLWRLPEIPFTHDEFSAILRTRFDSFSDLIRYGVRIDGHPAGVQVFLYYYIHWFGLSEAGLKLPFILAGTLSIGLIYLIGKEWFNGTTGLAAASFLAFLQYPVMYSQIARPYASGLFLSLLATWFWTRALFRPGRRFTLNLAGFVLTGTLCMYNHYFSFLFAGMVYLTGLFVCPRERRMAWFLSGPAMLLLFAPHIPIFLNQLGIGGVEGWLQKPRFDFLLDYLQYSFHFSVFVGLLVLTLISLALYWQGSRPEKRNRFMIISAAWFLIPWLTGYLYSIFRSSVLQYSVLIFSFPYLLFLVTGWFNTEKPRHQAIVAGLIALIVIPSLIIERRHYRLFYEGAYECIVKETQRQVTEKGADRCLVLLDTKPDINDYYLRKLKAPSLSFSLVEPGGSKGALAGRLDTCRARYLVFGALSSTRQEHYPMMLEKFPHLLYHRYFPGGDEYLFSKDPEAGELNEYSYSVTNTFEPSLPEWGWVDGNRCTDSLAIGGTRSYLVKAGEEFSPAYTHSLRGMIRSENDIIDVYADLRTPCVFPGAWLVVTVSSGGKDLKWCAAPVNDFVRPGHTGRVFQSLRISDVDMRHHGMKFAAYIWNPVKSPFLLDNFTVKVRSGNPLIYGLFRKL